MSTIKGKLPLFQAKDVTISKDVNLVWSIANTLRGAYRADKYRDVIIPNPNQCIRHCRYWS
ncbi:TPA: restriction endonuclease [Streptococcus suis]